METFEIFEELARLRESHATLEALITASPLAIFVLAPDGTVLLWNPAAERMFGWSAASVIGRPNPIVPPGKEASWRALCEHVLAGETFTNVEKRRWAIDGRQVDFSVAIAPLKRTSGEIWGLMALVADITDRVRAEAALQESEARYRLITENSGDLVSLLNKDWCYQYVSPSYQRILGLDPAELIDTPFLQRVYPEDRAAVQEQLTWLATRSAGRAIFRYQHADGRWRWLETQITPAFSQNDQMIVCAARDISERMQLEAELHQAQKMESLGRLASGIAHDFNNLLTAISGYANLALEELPADAPAKADLREIHAAARRATSLTSSLLAFSRKQFFALQVVNLNELIHSVERLLERLLGADTRLTVELHDPIWSIRADPSQIEQVLLNLVVNAQDAMPEGGTLKIATRNLVLEPGLHSPSPEQYVQLSVSDTGAGMPEEVLPHIFEPFFTTKEIGKGTGLGLATCYGIITQHQGTIDVASKVGEGTTFTIRFPRTLGIDEQSSHNDDSSTRITGSETILLAEDDQAVRQLTARILRSRGYTVLEAGNGKVALATAELSEHQPIHLLVTDVVMPEMGGSALAEVLCLRHPQIRVLFMSGYTDDPKIVRGVIESGVHVLLKPFTPTDLVQRVRALLDMPRDVI